MPSNGSCGVTLAFAKPAFLRRLANSSSIPTSRHKSWMKKFKSKHLTIQNRGRPFVRPSLLKRARFSTDLKAFQDRRITRVQDFVERRDHNLKMAAQSSTSQQSTSSQGFQYPDLSNSSFAPQLNLQGTTPYATLQSAEHWSDTTESQKKLHSPQDDFPEDMFPADADVEAELQELHAPQTSKQSVKQPSLDGSFCSPRGFYIPAERMQAALRAPSGSEASHWHYTLYKGPNEASPDVKVHYCSTKDQMEKVLKDHFMNETVLGFDLEWKFPSYGKMGIKQSVSLIQIANEERVGLFHLARFAGRTAADFVSPTLKAIVESPHVLKCGVAIKGDCTRLRKYLELDCQGQFELTHLYKLVKYHQGEEIDMNKRLKSLKDQAQDIFGLPLLKDEVRTSDWSTSKALSKDQCKYAASDAYACLQLFHQMDGARQRLDPVPRLPAHAEHGLPLIDTPIRKIVVPDDDELDSESSDGSLEGFISFSSDEEDDEDDIDEVSQNLAKIGLGSEDTAKATGPSSSITASSRVPPAESTASCVPPSAEWELAATWAAEFLALNDGRPVVSPSKLRAYHLWHHQDLEIMSITSIMRRPPLKPLTVSDYICEAVYNANLPAVPERVLDMSSNGFQPMRNSHKKLLTMASEVAARRRDTNQTYDDAANTGWWKG